MPAHARSARLIAARREPITQRSSTVMLLGVTVAGLAVATVLHSPSRAEANEPVATGGIDITTDIAGGVDDPTPTDAGDTRLARLVEIRQLRLQREARALRQERRERRAAREERQERRQEARAAARAAARAPHWVMPVAGGWSASFGESGSMWSSGSHTGQDWTAPPGTPVVAVSDGTITSATWSDAYGNIIEITHPDGDQSWYAHLSEFERSSGTVSPGDVIGYVGCTGNCFGDHLHFEYHPGGGDAADPVAWLRKHGAA
jgi:YD repeat-containing protein